jgi:ATP-dependent protease HslVU (ClpYQ) peptidase subunit
MTTIAWDGVTLAADRCSWSSGARRRARKVFKLKAPDGSQFLVAFAGSADYARSVMEWMAGGDRPNPLNFVTADQLFHQCALVIDDKHRIWQMCNSLIYTQMQERIYAFGGGQDFAWGALEAGASAKRAVEIAILRSDYAGFGVDCVRF